MRIQENYTQSNAFKKFQENLSKDLKDNKLPHKEQVLEEIEQELTYEEHLIDILV